MMNSNCTISTHTRIFSVVCRHEHSLAWRRRNKFILAPSSVSSPSSLYTLWQWRMAVCPPEKKRRRREAWRRLWALSLSPALSSLPGRKSYALGGVWVLRRSVSSAMKPSWPLLKDAAIMVVLRLQSAGDLREVWREPPCSSPEEGRGGLSGHSEMHVGQRAKTLKRYLNCGAEERSVSVCVCVCVMDSPVSAFTWCSFPKAHVTPTNASGPLAVTHTRPLIHITVIERVVMVCVCVCVHVHVCVCVYKRDHAGVSLNEWVSECVCVCVCVCVWVVCVCLCMGSVCVFVYG